MISKSLSWRQNCAKAIGALHVRYIYEHSGGCSILRIKSQSEETIYLVLLEEE